MASAPVVALVRRPMRLDHCRRTAISPTSRMQATTRTTMFQGVGTTKIARMIAMIRITGRSYHPAATNARSAGAVPADARAAAATRRTPAPAGPPLEQLRLHTDPQHQHACACAEHHGEQQVRQRVRHRPGSSAFTYCAVPDLAFMHHAARDSASATTAVPAT